MGLRGIAIGGVLGGILSRGSLLGVLFGAMLGHQVENRIANGRRRSSGGRQRTSGAWLQADSLSDAYAVLGARASDSSEELIRKYRELAKKNHPDVLRAQGMSEEMVSRATERMSRINAAWSEVRTARGI